MDAVEFVPSFSLLTMPTKYAQYELKVECINAEKSFLFVQLRKV